MIGAYPHTQNDGSNSTACTISEGIHVGENLRLAYIALIGLVLCFLTFASHFR